MRTASADLQTFLNAARSGDITFLMADCFTFTLAAGEVLTYTNLDQDIVYNGVTFLSTGPLVHGLKYKASIGLEVDKQQITIAARPTDLINGAGFLAALRDGAFDGATVQRDRVFMRAYGQPIIGGVTLFHGRVSTVDQVGRTSARVTVASDLVVLDYNVPRNLFSPTCLHTLYDSGCGVSKGSFATSGAVGSGSTAGLINFAGALAEHAQGSIIFTSGVDAEITATVKSVVAGVSLTLIYPLPDIPAVADTFVVYAGCDHTRATCQARFANLANHRAFPFVPPPQIAF